MNSATNVIFFPTHLNLDQASERLGIKPRTLYKKISEGQGPRRIKRYGRWFFLPEDLDAYLRAQSEVFEAFKR